MSHRRLRALAALVVVGSAALGLAGCGVAPWDQPQFRSSSSASSASKSAAPVQTPSPTITAIRNDLSAGSARHRIKAGDMVLTVTYWSTLGMNQWTPGADKPLSLSASAKSASDPLAHIYLSLSVLDVAVTGPHGALPSPPAQRDRATVKPGYDIRSPYTYGQSYVVSAVSAQATSLTFTFTYTLLEETAPDSGVYSKQTAIDSLTVALAG